MTLLLFSALVNDCFSYLIIIGVRLPDVSKPLIQDTNVLVGPKKERLEVKAALSNSFGFGGHNSSIIFSPYK